MIIFHGYFRPLLMGSNFFRPDGSLAKIVLNLKLLYQVERVQIGDTLGMWCGIQNVLFKCCVVKAKKLKNM